MDKSSKVDLLVELITKTDPIVDELYRESDRGCVLVGVAVLDEHLTTLLQSRFASNTLLEKKATKELIGHAKPLSSFYAKTMACFALQLISEEIYKDLEHIRSIRNPFAHTYTRADFNDEKVKELIDNLSSPKKFEEHILRLQLRDLRFPHTQIEDFLAPRKTSPLSDARMRFICAVAHISKEIESAIKNHISNPKRSN
jgi:DNA-binding MltR family transcriptional regulator